MRLNKSGGREHATLFTLEMLGLTDGRCVRLDTYTGRKSNEMGFFSIEYFVCLKIGYLSKVAPFSPERSPPICLLPERVGYDMYELNNQHQN
jgi:hypothetical protein